MAAVVALVIWASGWTGGGGFGGNAMTPTSTRTSTTVASTTVVRTTVTPTTVDTQVATLMERLPDVYRGNPSCAPASAIGAGVVAVVACTEANSTHFRFRPPDQAVFHLFTDRAAQDAHFRALVETNAIPREDESGGCRPLTRPAHYALYYRSTEGPVPGEFTTCFASGGVGQVWWVDTRTSTTGVLRSSTALDPDSLDQLGYWWNSMILTTMS
ncbi:MAG: hypothetical protein HOV94_24810 [Saccharothrix sp.]|nr:hypothetical protein [Saccharothrix sp.]